MKRWNTLRKLWAPFTECAASVYGASACYYILLSLLPAVLLLLHLLPYLPIYELRELLPQQLRPLADYILQLVQAAGDSLTVVSVSALVTLWSASKGILAISDGLNTVMGFPIGQRYIRRRLNAMVLFLCFMGLLTGLFLAQGLGRLLLPGLFRFSGLAAVLFLWIFFSMLYWLLPKRRIPLRYCMLGSFFTTAGWTAFSWLFSIYAGFFSSYQRLYGGIGLLLLACIWLQSCILLVLYGGLLSKLTAQNAYHPLRILREFIS